MSETMTERQAATITTIGWYRDVLRAATAVLSANAGHERAKQAGGFLDVLNAQAAQEEARRTFTSMLGKYQAAADACPLPATPATQIEVHVLREAEVAEDALRDKLATHQPALAQASTSEILDRMAAQSKGHSR